MLQRMEASSGARGLPDGLYCSPWRGCPEARGLFPNQGVNPCLCIGRWISLYLLGYTPPICISSKALKRSYVSPNIRSCPCNHLRVFPGGSVVSSLPTSAGDSGDAGSISGWGRFPGGKWQPTLQYSSLKSRTGGAGSYSLLKVHQSRTDSTCNHLRPLSYS